VHFINKTKQYISRNKRRKKAKYQKNVWQIVYSTQNGRLVANGTYLVAAEVDEK